MTAFAGFEMPVSYDGIIGEHRTVRAAAGLFDLSHMGEFEVAGPGAVELLERALTNSAAQLREGRAQYTLMCAEDGGVIDDLIVYRIAPKRYLLCVNASNIETDRAWLMGLDSGRSGFRDLSEETALVAIQGPQATRVLGSLAPSFAVDNLRFFGVIEGQVAGLRCIAARTGYTGEDGFELFTSISDAEALFAAFLEAGSGAGLKPCGLGARDTLRLEAALPLYGHELDRETSPLDAGLDPFVKFGRNFVGEDALLEQRRNGTRKRLVGLVTDDRRTIARQGYPVVLDDRPIGTVTSGTFAPTVGRPIAIAYVDAGELPESGAKVGVTVRRRTVSATITALPFYKKGRVTV